MPLRKNAGVFGEIHPQFVRKSGRKQHGGTDRKHSRPLFSDLERTEIAGPIPARARGRRMAVPTEYRDAITNRVIDSNAGGIETTTVRITRRKLSEAVCQYAAVW